MGPLQVIGGIETDPSRYIKTSLGSVGFSPAPGLEISCNPGRSLVLFLESTRTNLAPRPGTPVNNSMTNDQQSENNADSGVESTWISLGFHMVSLLPKEPRWTSQYYIAHIPPEICALCDARDRRKLVVHADNARPHVAKRVKQYLEDNNLKNAPHPPYSPDCSKGQNSRLQKSFSMGWFEFWLTFHSRP
jgi:hypothetical protein